MDKAGIKVGWTDFLWRVLPQTLHHGQSHNLRYEIKNLYLCEAPDITLPYAVDIWIKHYHMTFLSDKNKNF